MLGPTAGAVGLSLIVILVFHVLHLPCFVVLSSTYIFRLYLFGAQLTSRFSYI